MNGSIVVRRVNSAEDVAAASDLLTRFFAEDGFETSPQVIDTNTRKLATLDACGLFIAVKENVAVGVATISLEFGIEYGWSAEMGDLYVLPELRGAGVARVLIDAVEQFLVERGAAGYQVTVAPHGHENALNAFYTKLGFEDEGRVLRYKTLRRKDS